MSASANYTRLPVCSAGRLLHLPRKGTKRFPSLPQGREMFRANDISPVSKRCKAIYTHADLVPGLSSRRGAGAGSAGQEQTLAGRGGLPRPPPIVRLRPACLRERESVPCRGEGMGERGALVRNRAKNTGERGKKIQERHFIKQAVQQTVVGHGLRVSTVSILSVLPVQDS